MSSENEEEQIEHNGCIKRMVQLAGELDRMCDALEKKDEEYKQCQFTVENQGKSITYLEEELSKMFVQTQEEKSVLESEMKEIKEELNKVTNEYNKCQEEQEDHKHYSYDDDYVDKLKKELKDNKNEKNQYVKMYASQCEEILELQRQVEKLKQENKSLKLSTDSFKNGNNNHEGSGTSQRAKWSDEKHIVTEVKVSQFKHEEPNETRKSQHSRNGDNELKKSQHSSNGDANELRSSQLSNASSNTNLRKSQHRSQQES